MLHQTDRKIFIANNVDESEQELVDYPPTYDLTKNKLTMEDVRYSFLHIYQEIYLPSTDLWSSLKRICQWRFVEMSNDPDPLLELQTVNCWRL